MSTTRGTVVALIALLLVPRVGRACDSMSYESAYVAEREHRLGDAIHVRTLLVACAPDDSSLTNEFALASDHAAIGDFDRAAELIERAAEHAPAARVSAARLSAAMLLALEYRLALRDLPRAQADALWLLDSSDETAIEPAFAVGTALEENHQWTEASQWYDALARRFPARAQWAVQARALVGLGRAYAALGDLQSALRSWEAANSRWPVARAALGIADPCPLPPPPRPAPRRRSARDHRGVVSPFGQLTEAGTDECAVNGNFLDDSDGPLRFFAEAQFRLARLAADPCARPAEYGDVPQTRPDFDRWVVVELTPMIQRRQACLDDATRHLVDVVNLHVPQWEVAAVAVIAHLYGTFAWTIRRAPIPPDLRYSDPDRSAPFDAYHLIR